MAIATKGGVKMRLIDADALKTKGFADEYTGEGIVYVEDIDNAPTISPDSLRPKGRWRHYNKRGIAVCTNCSFERNLFANFGKAISCPNCGADMREEKT